MSVRVPPPVLEPRRADGFAATLRGQLPAYVPGWQPQAGGPGDALLLIYARFLDALGERIDRTPDKNELAFLDQLGLDLLPAQAARAPVVFTTSPQLGDARAPAGTRLAASAPGGGDPIVFETETEIALPAARIAEVVTVWPALDAFADHGAEALGGRPFTLWEPLQPIRHELYVAHPLHLALTGHATVELDVELAANGSAPLKLVWQYWDGDLWRDFGPPEAGDDGTAGLTRSGAVALRSDCAQAKPTTVGGVKSFWLRASLADPLPPDASRALPQVDRLALRTVLERKVGADCTIGLLPDTAFAGALRLDATKPFQPLGPAPGSDAVLYLACAEAFSRPGAEVEICIDRPQTAQELADEEGDQYAAEITTIIGILLSLASSSAAELQEIGSSVVSLADQASPGTIRLQSKIDAVGDAAAALTDLSGLDALARTAGDLVGSIGAVTVDVVEVSQSVPDVDATRAALGDMSAKLSDASERAADLASWIDGILGLVAQIVLGVFGGDVLATAAHQHTAGTIVEDIAKAVLDFAVAGTEKDTLRQRASTLADSLDNIAGALAVPDATRNAADAVGPTPVDLIWKTDSVVDEAATRQRILDSAAASRQAAGDGKDALVELAKLSPFDVGTAVGVTPPALDPPTLVWEYWTGTGWSPVSVTPSATGVDNLMASGSLKFTVPPDWDESLVNGTRARWLRARLQGGVYGKLRLVTWVDTQTKRLNVMPVIEPRPPEVKALRIGYRWVSDAAAPERCLTLNDFQWADRTDEAAWRGSAFAPFVPTGDLVPTLYLGFDRPLPADLVGLFLDIAEAPDDTAGPPLEWQCWDGSGWSRVSVEDETADLALPGAVRVLWPGTGPLAEAQIAATFGAAVQVADARAAAAFAPGDLLWVSQGAGGELATVDAVAGDTVALRAPLAGSYARGTVARAGLPRFGVPRTWLRARLRTDGDPRRSTVSGLYSNAVWAAQVQTIRDELLGSSNGQPRQTFFFARSPVLRGETIEVRELEGPAAAVEYPLLVDELARAGIRETDLRTVRSPQTGKLSEVWVPWRERPSLLFSGPDDRDYAVERSHGRLIFGDGANGRIPPAGSNSIRARIYRSGGGTAGNVPAGAISQALSGVVVQGVSNPRPGEGGAEGEPDDAVLGRGPLTLRNWRQALSTDDYEALAREASPAVALARALPLTAPGGRRAPGWVTVVVVPRSTEAEPQPSYELRREVRSFLLTRTPAALAGRLAVVGPSYLRVGVEAVVAPKRLEQGGAVAEAVRAALAAFLHPLTGGPDGGGWGSRRDVCLSDVAALLEPLDGVDYVETLLLVDRGVPTGDVLSVPDDRLVAAGPVTVRLTGQEA